MFRRIVSLFLVLCLIADPLVPAAMAADPPKAFAALSASGAETPFFQEQVLMLRVTSVPPMDQWGNGNITARFWIGAQRLRLTRLGFLAALGFGTVLTAWAQSATQPKRRSQLSKTERSRLNSLRRPEQWGESDADKDALARTAQAIKNLDNPDGQVRSAARDEIIGIAGRVESEEFHVTDAEENPKNPYEYAARFQPITSQLETVFKYATDKTHTRSGIWKILAAVDPGRARTMAREFFGYMDPSTIFDRSVRLARTTLYAERANGRDDTDQTLDVYLYEIANLGRRYLTESADAALRAAAQETPPANADALITVRYLSILGVLQAQRPLWNPDALARLILKIIQTSELDAEQGANMDWNYKIGPAALSKFKEAPELLFDSGHELGHNWTYAQSAVLAGNRTSLELKAIDEFISDIFGLMLLEALGILDGEKLAATLFHDQDFCLSCVLGPNQPGFADEAGRVWIAQQLAAGPSAPGRWAALFQVIAREILNVREKTTFQEFLTAVSPSRAGVVAPHSAPRFGPRREWMAQAPLRAA